MIDYIAMMQKYHGSRNDGLEIKLSEDDYIRVRYDAKTMRWIASRPSRIKYPTARKLINQYRKEYAKSNGRLRLTAEKWGNTERAD